MHAAIAVSPGVCRGRRRGHPHLGRRPTPFPQRRGPMSTTPADDSLEDLLQRLQRGDIAAAEQIFLTYEPYLRLLVRRQLSAALRAKFDSPDIVQSVWVDVLRGFRASGCRFTSAAHLRAYLVRATRNRFIDRLRHHQKALDREQPLESTQDQDLPPSPQPEP